MRLARMLAAGAVWQLSPTSWGGGWGHFPRVTQLLVRAGLTLGTTDKELAARAGGRAQPRLGRGPF